jgi:outer membrane protein assembly factor BamD
MGIFKLLHGTTLKGVVVAVTLSVLTTGCGFFGEEPDPTLSWSAQKLYESGKRSLDNGSYEAAIGFYQKLETRFPFGAYSIQAQLESTFAYYKKNEPASAVAAADRFIRLHPQHPSVDYAYYMKGLAQFDQGRGFVDQLLPMDPSQRDPGLALQSFEAFSDLVNKYPNSRYSKDARQRMLYLRNNLAQHEVHVANYYMRRGAFIAAANRARYVVENYDTTPSVPEALVIMAQAYKVLDMADLSDSAVRVLKLNYPEHPGVADVKNLQLTK